MANSWLRLYHEMPNDPKWRTIARAAKQTIPLVLSVYVHLLTIASGAIERGTLVNVNSEDLASALDVDCASVDAVLEAMQGRVLEGEKVSGWSGRQVNREDSSTERMREHRNRKVTQGDAHVTQSDAVKRNVTADKSREEEIRQEETKPLASSAQALPASPVAFTVFLTRGKTHLVSEDDVKRAQQAFPAVDVRQEMRTMIEWLDAHPEKRSHGPKGAKSRIVNWMSKKQDKGGNYGNSNSKPDGLTKYLETLRTGERAYPPSNTPGG